MAGTPSVDAVISGVTLDSRQVQPGDLYAALPGAHVHGAQFAEQALSAGAAAVLTDPAGAARIGDAAAPMLIVADPRAVLGDVAAAIYGDPTRAADSARRHRHQWQDHRRLPARGGAAPPPGIAPGWSVRCRRELLMRSFPACVRPRRPPSCRRCSRRCGSVGSTPPRWRSPAMPWPCTGSTAAGSRVRRSPTSARTTSISTPPSRTTSRPRPRSSTPSVGSCPKATGARSSRRTTTTAAGSRCAIPMPSPSGSGTTPTGARSMFAAAPPARTSACSRRAPISRRRPACSFPGRST